MKIIVILSLILPISLFSQEIIRCGDSANYVVKNIGSENITIKIIGEIKQLQNPQVFLLNKTTIIQLLINDKKDYSKYGNDELSILTSYIMSEGEYFSAAFKNKLDLAMIPENLNGTRKAIFWHLSLPPNITSNSDNKLKALKSVFISSVKNDRIITIATTQFDNQKLENIEKHLVELTKTIEIKNNSEICEN